MPASKLQNESSREFRCTHSRLENHSRNVSGTLVQENLMCFCGLVCDAWICGCWYASICDLRDAWDFCTTVIDVVLSLLPCDGSSSSCAICKQLKNKFWFCVDEQETKASVSDLTPSSGTLQNPPIVRLQNCGCIKRLESTETKSSPSGPGGNAAPTCSNMIFSSAIWLLITKASVEPIPWQNRVCWCKRRSSSLSEVWPSAFDKIDNRRLPEISQVSRYAKEAEIYAKLHVEQSFRFPF